MFVTFLIGLVVIYAVAYTVFVVYDMFLLSKQEAEAQEVVIDITPSLVEYVPIDAEYVINKEQKQNMQEVDEIGDKKNASQKERVNNEKKWKDEDEGEEKDKFEDGEDMMFEQLSEGDDDDYTPLNASEEYNPLEFKKMLQDSYQSDNLFYEVFHSDVKYESMDDDENYKEE